jgi:hypothetical protein
MRIPILGCPRAVQYEHPQQRILPFLLINFSIIMSVCTNPSIDLLPEHEGGEVDVEDTSIMLMVM